MGHKRLPKNAKSVIVKRLPKGEKAQRRGALEDPRRGFVSNKHHTWLSVFFILGFISQLVLRWDGEKGAGGMIGLKAQQKGNLHLILDGSEQV